jgi:hypothetical protein
MLKREHEGDWEILKRRAAFVRDGIPRELYVERATWARQARSAALFRALAALAAWPAKRIEALWGRRTRERPIRR